jgi:hypothetical protein
VSCYDNDARVDYNGGGIYDIELPGIAGLPGSQNGRVQPCSNSFMFEAFMLTDNPIKHEFRTADEAIQSLIGDPQ